MKGICNYFSEGVKFRKPVTQSAKGTFFSLLLATCAAFSACNDETESLSMTNRLKLSFGINRPDTRAIFTDATLPDASPVGVKLEEYSYTGLTYTGTTTGGKQTWTPNQDVVLTETSGTLYAYWPYSEAIDMTAIPVDMTADDQTDWLYATPVSGIDEEHPTAEVVMNHALANINISVVKDDYVGEGKISSISVTSKGIAPKGTFNVVQAVPGYTSFENEGKTITRTVNAVMEGTPTDIMVVPTGLSGSITFSIIIDNVEYAVATPVLTLEMGNNYQYTLTLKSTFLSVTSFTVQTWNPVPKDNLALGKPLKWNKLKNGVYAVSANKEPMYIEAADETCIGVVLVQDDNKFMIEKNGEANEVYGGSKSFTWGKNFLGLDVLEGPFTYNSTKDYNGKKNTEGLLNAYATLGKEKDTQDMCVLLEAFNAANDQNQGFNDWYIPAVEQLKLICAQKTNIDTALENMNGTKIGNGSYWSSSEGDFYYGVYHDFYYNSYQVDNKNVFKKIRFIRDLNFESTENTGLLINSAGKANGVYVITATGELVDKATAAADAIGVALITDNQRIMIAKSNASDGTNNTLYWGYNLQDKDVEGINNTSSSNTAKTDYNGAANTAAIIAAYSQHSVTMDAKDMCKVLASYAEGGFTDWYVPAAGQLYEIYTNKSAINSILSNIGGTSIDSGSYWSSSECNADIPWIVYFNDGGVYDSYGKACDLNVRLVRNIN